jgi:uncharacterized membrane protein
MSSFLAEHVLPIKWLHILSSALLFGTGLGTAFHGLRGSISGDLRAIAVTSRSVVVADWVFTTPAVILQPTTGILLVLAQGWPLTTPWLLLSLGLYALAGACWLPVVWLQIRMQRLATAALEAGTELPDAYRRCFHWWFALGWPAFSAVILVFYLMVVKPDL